MKTPAFLLGKILLVALLGSLPLFSGCQTKPRVDWAMRVGHYTFDQAVTEYGPPDKSSKLSDGTLVSEWRQARPSSRVSIGFGTGFVGRHTSVGVGHTIHTSDGAKWLRLTFAPDGTLRGHEHFRR